MKDGIKIPECCDERFSGIRKKVTYKFKSDNGLDMTEDISVRTIVNPRAYLDDQAFYPCGRTSYKGNSVKHGCNLKAVKARRKKNKNKKTHRR